MNLQHNQDFAFHFIWQEIAIYGKAIVTIPKSQDKLLREDTVCVSLLVLLTVTSKILAPFHSNMFRLTNDRGTDGRQTIRKSPPMLSVKNKRKTKRKV